MTTGAGEMWRRTTIELGPLRITREYRCAPPGPHYPFYEPARTRTGGGWRAAGALGVVLALSAGGLSMAATRMPAPRAPAYSVSVPVPTRVIAPAHAVPVVKVPKRATEPKGAAVEPAGDDALPGDNGSRAVAIAAALRSGEVQEWFEAAGQVHGFVVAGAAEEDAGRTCRALSVLTRTPGGADKVDQRRECLPAAG